MHGVGEATAAVTFVNAIPTGIGAAAGVDLRTRAEIRWEPEGAGSPLTLSVVPRSSDTPLVRSAVQAAFERAGIPGAGTVGLALTSAIPHGAGLKSSSAVASAIARAIDAAVGGGWSAEAIAQVSAMASRRAGVSATGAFDDALAGLVPGVVVTDNRADRLLTRHPVPAELEVALWIPGGSHPPSPEIASRFRSDDPEAVRAADAALHGRLWEAMDANSRLVDAVMGYDHRLLRERLLRAGAVACGTSGLGPAFAAIGPRGRMEELVETLPSSGGERLRIAFHAGAGMGGDP